MMKNIALFQGQLRGFKYTFKNLETNLLRPLDITTLLFYLPEDDKIQKIEDFIPNTYDIKVVYEKELIHCENGIPYCDRLTYNEQGIKQNNYVTKGSTQHYLIQLYNKKRIFDIFKSVKNVFDYKWIVLLRPDLNPLETLNINELQINSVNVPKCPSWSGVYDRLCISTPEIMDVYTKLYDNIKHVIPDEDTLKNPESRLKKWLQINNLPINMYNVENIPRINIDGSYRGS